MCSVHWTGANEFKIITAVLVLIMVLSSGQKYPKLLIINDSINSGGRSVCLKLPQLIVIKLIFKSYQVSYHILYHIFLYRPLPALVPFYVISMRPRFDSGCSIKRHGPNRPIFPQDRSPKRTNWPWKIVTSIALKFLISSISAISWKYR